MNTKHITHTTLVTLLLSIPGCEKSGTDSDAPMTSRKDTPESPDSAADDALASTKPLKIGQPDESTHPRAHEGLIQSASLDAASQTLTINVIHGGCEENIFELWWDGNLAETHPAQAEFILTHVEKGETCPDNGELRELKFDIGSAKFTQSVDVGLTPGNTVVSIPSK